MTGRVAALRRRLGGLPAGMLAAFFGVSLSLWIFLTVGGEMVEGETRAFDEFVLLALRNPLDLNDPIGPRWLEEAVRDVTSLGGFTVLTLITVVSVVALVRSARRIEAAAMALVVIGAQISSETLKLIYARPRPSLVPHESYVYSNSFPSGHSAMSAAVYLMLAILIAGMLKRRQSRTLTFGLAIAVVVAVGCSRAYLGVHWPTDVLAGWALGGGWAICGGMAINLLQGPRAGVSGRA